MLPTGKPVRHIVSDIMVEDNNLTSLINVMAGARLIVFQFYCLVKAKVKYFRVLIENLTHEILNENNIFE